MQTIPLRNLTWIHTLQISKFYFYSLILFKSMRYHQCHQKYLDLKTKLNLLFLEFFSLKSFYSLFVLRNSSNNFHSEIKYCYHIVTTLYYTIRLNPTILSELIVYIKRLIMITSAFLFPPG